MLKSLNLKNFTVFRSASLDFSDNVNIFVGENGLGKTHLLKIIYGVASTLATGQKISNTGPTKAFLQNALATSFREVFKPDALGRLVRRQAGRNRCDVSAVFENSAWNIGFSLNTATKSEIPLEISPSQWLDKRPVYLPTHDLMGLYPGFVSLYELNRLPVESIWRDVCLLLGSPLAKGPREKIVKKLLEPLEEVMDGKIELDGERFYLKSKTGRIEMSLVAEGHRKLAMIARLIATGSLLDKGLLLWDEPEANLNPVIIKKVAKTILELASQGLQIFIATHSLFLLRELQILQQSDAFETIEFRCFGLHNTDDGVEIKQGESMDDIGDISALDEELMQSERYLKLC